MCFHMVACESSFVVGGASGFLCMSDVVGELKGCCNRCGNRPLFRGRRA